MVGKDIEGGIYGLFKLLSQHLAGGTEEKFMTNNHR
jgi:hypothetical protein